MRRQPPISRIECRNVFVAPPNKFAVFGFKNLCSPTDTTRNNARRDLQRTESSWAGQGIISRVQQLPRTRICSFRLCVCQRRILMRSIEDPSYD